VAADRDCATDCDRDGTGGTGGGGASALFDDDERLAPKVIDRDLRNVRDSLRSRVPVEEGEATDGARVGRWGDGDSAGGGTANFDGCEGGKDSGARRGVAFGRAGVEGDLRNWAGGREELSLLSSDPVSLSSASDS
jgi:hypothetical protein